MLRLRLLHFDYHMILAVSRLRLPLGCLPVTVH